MKRKIFRAEWFCLGVFFLLTVGLFADDRTWTDRNGKFQIEGTLLDFDGKNVKLKKKEDGKIISLALDKLSLPDQVYVRKTMETLGGPATTPDEPEKPAPRTGPRTGTRIKTPEEIKKATAAEIDPSAVPLAEVSYTGETPVTLTARARKLNVDGAQTTWTATADPLPVMKLDFQPRALTFTPGEMPFGVFPDTTDFFFSPANPELVLTAIQMHRGLSEYKTQVYLGDTKSGKVVSQLCPVKLTPMGLSPDGTRALFAYDNKEASTFHGQTRLVIVDVRDPKLPCIGMLTPFEMERNDRDRAIEWADWADDEHLLVQSTNGIFLLEAASGKAVWGIEKNTDTPVFSPGKRYMLVNVRGKGYHLLETISGKVIGKIQGPEGLRFFSLRNPVFSPDGTRIAASYSGWVYLWDATTGRTVEPFFIDQTGRCHWVDDKTLLVGGTLVDIGQMLPYWNYSGTDSKDKMFAGRYWNLKNNRGGRSVNVALTPFMMPHESIPKLPQLDEKRRFAVRPGMTVKLTVDSTVPDQREVRAEMVKKLQENGITVNDGASVTLALRAMRADTTKVEYTDSRWPGGRHGNTVGEASFTPYVMTCGYEKDGDVLWEARTQTSPPGTVSNEDVSRLQQVVSESGKPTANWYMNVDLPKRIPHKKAGQSPLGGR